MTTIQNEFNIRQHLTFMSNRIISYIFYCSCKYFAEVSLNFETDSEDEDVLGKKCICN